MSEKWNESGWQDDRTAAEIVRDRVEMLAAAFSKKTSDRMIVVFQEALEGYPKGVLKTAFVKAERELERFPTPKVMRSICNENMPSESWRYDFEPAMGKDPGTGNPVRILIDKDPSCDRCREPHSKHPFIITDQKTGEKKTICARPVDRLNAREMYRPQDCPEGRGFLAALQSFKKVKLT